MEKTAEEILKEVYMWLMLDYKVASNFSGYGWMHCYDSDEHKAMLEKIKPFVKIKFSEVVEHNEKKINKTLDKD